MLPATITKIHQAFKEIKHMAIDSMRERTELSGGSFSIESRIGEGTIIRATWPVVK